METQKDVLTKLGSETMTLMKKFASFLAEKRFSGKIISWPGCDAAVVAAFNKETFFTKMVGTDAGVDRVREFRSRYPQDKGSFELQRNEALTYPDNYVDAFFVAEFVSGQSMPKVMSEIYRTLKPGGYAYVVFYKAKVNPGVNPNIAAGGICNAIGSLNIRSWVRSVRHCGRGTYVTKEIILQKPGEIAADKN